MEWVIIVSMLAIMVYGFFLMDRLDRFLASPRYHPDVSGSLQTSEKGYALVFGRLSLSHEITMALEKQKIPFDKIMDISELNFSKTYQYLIAVDSQDIENLTICKVCEKMMDIDKRAAVCNCHENARLYETNQIPYLKGKEIAAQALLSMVLSPLPTDRGRLDTSSSFYSAV